MSLNAPEISDPLQALTRFLTRLRRRDQLARSLARIAPVLSVALALLVVLAILDARVELSPIARALTTLTAIGITLACALRLIVILRPPTDRRLAAAARLAERRLEIEDSRIINALQLGVTSRETGDTLTRRALDRGAAAIIDHHPTSLINWRSARYRMASLATIAASIAIVAMAYPRFGVQLAPRFLDPFADHPPFSWTDFAFAVEPSEITLGDDASISLTLTGQLPAATSLLTSTAAAIPMARDWSASDETRQVYRATLPDLARPITLTAHADTGRSRAFTITPIPRPRILSATLTAKGNAVSLSTDSAVPPTLAAPPGTLIDAYVQCSAPLTDMQSLASPISVASLDGANAHIQIRAPESGEATFTLRPVGEEGLAAHGALTFTLIAATDVAESATALGEESSLQSLAPLSGASGDQFATAVPDPSAAGAAEISEDEQSSPHAGAASDASQPGADTRGAAPPPSTSTDAPRFAKPALATRSRAITTAPQASDAIPLDPAAMESLPESMRSLASRYFQIINQRSRDGSTR